MEHAQKTYLPAAGRDWALPFYDPMVALLGVDARRAALVGGAALQPHQRALDIGCGTGSLVVWIKRRYPSVYVAGLDPDPKALARAEQKAHRASVQVRLDQGFADRLPYADASFDRVFSSFMFHHLVAADRPLMLSEVRRVLKPDGSLHLVDFAGLNPRLGRMMRWLGPGHHLDGTDEQHLLALMRDTGFTAGKDGEGTVLAGLARIAYYHARV